MTMTTAAVRVHADDGGVRDDDAAARPTRRRFSAAYKLSILDEYERLTDPGAKGALLRREGLYTSHLVDWRRARERGALRELAPGRRPQRQSPERQELERLRKRTARLEEQLARHKQALEIQGKASELLARLLAESDEETGQQP
jgi:transposase-like protein